MAQKTTYTCDRCGAERKEANHWFRSGRREDGVLIIAPWQHGMLRTEERHLCGEACLAAEVAEFAASR